MGASALLIRIFSSSPASTRALGRLLGERLEPGACVGLRGELGAGKTALAGGIGEGLGVAEAMRSPSYLLCCEHRGRTPVLHLDAYFEARMESLLAEGLAARFTSDAVVLIEWADRLAAWWPPDRLDVALRAGAEPDGRSIELRALGPRSAATLAALPPALAAAGIPFTQAEPAPAPPR